MKVTPKLKRKSVVLSYKLNNILYEVYVGISIAPERWSSSKKEIKGEGALIAEKNAKIKRLQNEIELYVLKIQSAGKEYFHEELKNFLKSLESNESSIYSSSDLISFFSNYISDGEYKYAIGTIKSYKTTKRHFSDFIKSKGKKSIAFDSVTTQFLREFNRHLDKRVKLSPSTRGKHIKNIKAVMNEALRASLHSNRDFQDIKKDNESSPNVYLGMKEILDLNHFTAYTEAERKMIDSFIFICLTGIRYTDFANLEEGNVSVRKHGDKDVWFLSYVQDKSNEEVEVPIMHEEAINILIKYNNQIPKFANAYMNRFLKEIFTNHDLLNNTIELKKEKIKGTFIKRDLITIHTGRRSFCTNQYLQGTPTQFIMAASGHKTESAFRLYIKADQLDKAKGLLNYIDY